MRGFRNVLSLTIILLYLASDALGHEASDALCCADAAAYLGAAHVE
jgi:hypothetical protein